MPPPLRAAIRDHLRGPGPLLRGCRGCEVALFEIRSGGEVHALAGVWHLYIIMFNVELLYLKMGMAYNNYHLVL